MKKRETIVAIMLCIAMLFTACGTDDKKDSVDAISEEQAYNAVINYNKAIGSGVTMRSIQMVTQSIGMFQQMKTER